MRFHFFNGNAEAPPGMFPRVVDADGGWAYDHDDSTVSFYSDKEHTDTIACFGVAVFWFVLDIEEETT